MTTDQIDRMTESALFKLIVPVLLTVIIAFGTWGMGKLSERLDRFDKYLSDAQADKATTELRLKQLEQREAAAEATLENLRDKTSTLGFKVDNLQQIGGRR